MEKCQFLEMEPRKMRKSLDSSYYQRRRATNLISCFTIELWQDEKRFTHTKLEKFD
jgi:hypothetical protein